MCPWVCYRKRRHHQLQPLDHFRVWLQCHQDHTHGNSTSCRRHDQWSSLDGHKFLCAEPPMHLLDLFILDWPCWCTYGPHSRQQYASRCISGGRIPYGLLQRSLGIHAQPLFFEHCRCHQEEFHGHVDCCCLRYVTFRKKKHGRRAVLTRTQPWEISSDPSFSSTNKPQHMPWE